MYGVQNRVSAQKPSGKWLHRDQMTTRLLEISAKTRRNKRESTTMESSMIIIIVVVETLAVWQQALIPMVVLQTNCS